ncbi:hypothetical protein HYE67_009059 [Fusarium culmorum]|uniref:Uncharacterized protein n=1 Tax=Fusarium culmorum TaxID=5516 RepID=A0A7S8DE01_FUSCU|nr:hypothetical protein HYE67_009059 [Fusarium culmorum]
MPMHLSITTTTVEADFHLAKDNKQKMISYRQDAQLKHWDQTTAQVEGFVLPNTPDPEHIYSSIAHRCDIVLMNHEGKKNKTKGTLRVTAAGYVEYHSRLSSLTTMHQLSTIPRLSNYGLQVMINDPWGALLVCLGKDYSYGLIGSPHDKKKDVEHPLELKFRRADNIRKRWVRWR